MSDKASSDDVAGWTVRITTPSNAEEFYLVVMPDREQAEAKAARRAAVLGNETIEAVGELSQSMIDGLGLVPGEVRRRSDA